MTVEFVGSQICNLCNTTTDCYYVYAFDFRGNPIKDEIYGKMYCKICWEDFDKIKKYRILHPYNNRVRCRVEGSSHPCIVCGTYVDNGLLICPGDRKCFIMIKKMDLCMSRKNMIGRNYDDGCNGIHNYEKYEFFDKIIYDCNCGAQFKIKNDEYKKDSQYKYIGKPQRTPYGELRHVVYQRDNYKCKECGATNEEIKLEIDHIIPFSKGGKTELENLQTLCRIYNHSKHTRTWVGGQ